MNAVLLLKVVDDLTFEKGAEMVDLLYVGSPVVKDVGTLLILLLLHSSPTCTVETIVEGRNGVLLDLVDASAHVASTQLRTSAFQQNTSLHAL